MYTELCLRMTMEMLAIKYGHKTEKITPHTQKGVHRAHIDRIYVGEFSIMRLLWC